MVKRGAAFAETLRSALPPTVTPRSTQEPSRDAMTLSIPCRVAAPGLEDDAECFASQPSTGVAHARRVPNKIMHMLLSGYIQG